MVSWTTNYSSTAVDGKQIQLNPLRKLAWLVQMIHFLLRNVLVFSGSTFVHSLGVMCQTFKLVAQPQNQSRSITQLLRDLHPGLCHCGGQFLFRGWSIFGWNGKKEILQFFTSRGFGSWNPSFLQGWKSHHPQGGFSRRIVWCFCCKTPGPVSVSVFSAGWKVCCQCVVKVALYRSWRCDCDLAGFGRVGLVDVSLSWTLVLEGFYMFFI